MILQNPMTGFDPLCRIGDQMKETYQAHGMTDTAQIHRWSAKDLFAITYLCDRVLFLHRGRVAEECQVADIGQVKQEYSRQLLHSIIGIGSELKESQSRKEMVG